MFALQMERGFNCPKGNILFSNELARRYGGDDGIVSISLFPGAINADFAGYANTFFTRLWQMVAAFICFIVEGGDLDALAEDARDKARDAEDRATRPLRDAEGRRERREVRIEDIDAEEERLSELSNASLRAITSLYAGTDPAAGRLNGKVRALSSFRICFWNTDLPHV